MYNLIGKRKVKNEQWIILIFVICIFSFFTFHLLLELLQNSNSLCCIWMRGKKSGEET